MKSKLNKVMDDKLINQAKNFFTSRDGWFTLIGLGIGVLFGAMPVMLVVTGIVIGIYIFVVANKKSE